MKEQIYVNANIKHISEDLYLINRQAISFADNGFDLDSDELKFGNPRYFVQDGKMNAKGLLNDAARMETLREAIRTQGLKHTPQIRIINGEKFEIVDGERRIRSLFKLISDDAEVFDPVTKQFVPAKEKYDWIQVRIEEMDDLTAISRAYTSNDNAIEIGEAATVALVKKLRKCGIGDEEICKITKRGISWLRETDKIINLDDNTFQALASEKINRTLAIKLSELEEEDRASKLDALLDAAQLRLEKIQQQLSEAKDRAENRVDMAEAEIIEAEYRGSDAEKAKKRKIKAEKRIEEIEEEKNELEEKGAKANIKDWDGAKPLTSIKIKKYWVEPLNDLENDGTIDEEDVSLLKTICEKIEIGEKDILQILRDHKEWKIQNGYSQQVEIEEEI